MYRVGMANCVNLAQTALLGAISSWFTFTCSDLGPNVDPVLLETCKQVLWQTENNLAFHQYITVNLDKNDF